jgi:hypothetical protein
MVNTPTGFLMRQELDAAIYCWASLASLAWRLWAALPKQKASAYMLVVRTLSAAKYTPKKILLPCPLRTLLNQGKKRFCPPGSAVLSSQRLIRLTLSWIRLTASSSGPSFVYAIDPSVQTVEKKVYLNATPNGKRGIDFEMYPGKTYGANALQRVTFHESMHILGWQTDSADKTIFSDSGLAGYHQYARQRKRDIDDANGVDFDVRSYDIDPARVPQLDQDGLFPLFDESAYDGSVTGHPSDDLNELMASSLTVMHYFPNEVVDSMETLCPDDRRITAQYMGSLITAGKEVAADPQTFETFFKPQLTDYIAGAGLR